MPPDRALLQQPHNLDAEKATLGTILIDNTRLAAVQQAVTPESFYDAGHQAIYEAILGLSERGSPIDPTTVCADLLDQGRLEVAGGPTYISQLEGAVISTTNVRSHFTIVKEKAERRRLIRAANSIAEMAYDTELPNDKLALASDKAVYDVLCSMRPDSCMQGMDTLTQEMVDEIEDKRNRNISNAGLALPWPHLSSFFRGGIQPTDSVVLAARTSVGKTAMALNIATHLAIHQNKRIAFFSLEMDRRQLWNRIAAQVMRVPATSFQEPTEMSKRDFDALIRAGAHTLGSCNLVIDDTGGLDISVLRARAREMHMERPLALIVIDYLQLVTDGSVRERASRQEEVSSISQKVKALAKELSVPVLSLAQLSRQVEQRGRNAVPQLSDLRESGAIEQDADIVAMIHRPKMYRPGEYGETIVFVRKNRNGATGEVAMALDLATQCFREVGADADDELPDY